MLIAMKIFITSEMHKVRHKLFSNDEFFELRSGKDWEDGWLIID